MSRLGFGTMRFPLLDDGKIDERETLELLDLAYEKGVNYFDTAYIYHDGAAESVLGKALSRYPRDTFFLANKLPVWLVNEIVDVDRLFLEQLEKCGVEFFDAYLLHSMDRNRWKTVRDLGIYENLLQKKQQGKIGALGFSFHGDYETFFQMTEVCEWDFVQIMINYIDYRMVDTAKLHKRLTEKKIPCVVMEPVRGGFLANLPPAAAAAFENCRNSSYAAWAFRWCMNMENMPLILSGMSSREQVEDNLRTFSEEYLLSPEEKKAIEKAGDALLALKTIPCTGCRYCMDCPDGVNIPGVFEAYNRLKIFENKIASKVEYINLGREHYGNRCTSCGKCLSLCPQNIAVPQQLSMAHGTFASL